MESSPPRQKSHDQQLSARSAELLFLAAQPLQSGDTGLVTCGKLNRTGAMPGRKDKKSGDRKKRSQGSGSGGTDSMAAMFGLAMPTGFSA